MIQTDTIIINSTLLPVYVLTYYDGIKEEVDIKNHTLFLWYDEYTDFELWLKIKPKSRNILLDYLRDRIGVKDVIESSSVELYRRSFDNYKVFHKYEETSEEIELPENVHLGQNFINILNAERTIKTTFISQDNSPSSLDNVDFTYVFNNKIVQTKITSSNDANFELFEIMAA